MESTLQVQNMSLENNSQDGVELTPTNQIESVTLKAYGQTVFMKVVGRRVPEDVFAWRVFNAFLGNGEGGHREAGHGAGPCMLHNASYDFNDELLPVGATYWVRLAERYLKEGIVR